MNRNIIGSFIFEIDRESASVCTCPDLLSWCRLAICSRGRFCLERSVSAREAQRFEEGGDRVIAATWPLAGPADCSFFYSNGSNGVPLVLYSYNI